MTLKFNDYLAQILRPSIINGIERGDFDRVIDDPDLDCIYKDTEVLKAILERRKVLHND